MNAILYSYTTYLCVCAYVSGLFFLNHPRLFLLKLKLLQNGLSNFAILARFGCLGCMAKLGGYGGNSPPKYALRFLLSTALSMSFGVPIAWPSWLAIVAISLRVTTNSVVKRFR